MKELRNKKGQEISINFLVMFIIAIVVFGLGVILMWRIFYSGTDTLDITQNEFDKRLFALNCKSSEVVCVGANSVEIDAGENILFSMKVFNNHDFEIVYDINYLLKNDQDEIFTSDSYGLLPSSYSNEKIPAKGDKEFLVQLGTKSSLPKGKYALRILVSPESFDSIPKRIYIEVK